jgi:flagellar biogenesis protein FliO
VEWIVLKTVLSLALVVGLMLGVVFLVRKFSLGSGGHNASQIDIDVLGWRTLQGRRSVAVLRVLDKVIVVGISEDGMSTLAEMQWHESMSPATPMQAASPSLFQGILGRYMGTRAGRSGRGLFPSPIHPDSDGEKA